MLRGASRGCGASRAGVEGGVATAFEPLRRTVRITIRPLATGAGGTAAEHRAIQQAVRAANRFDAAEKIKSDDGGDDVGRPDARKGRDSSLAGPVVASDPEKVICADQNERNDEAGGPAAAAWTHANGNAEQSEDKARGGEGNSIVELHTSIAPIRTVACKQTRNGLFGDA